MRNNTITSDDIFNGCTISGRVGRTVKVFAIDGAVVLERPERTDYSVGYENACNIREIPCGCKWKKEVTP